MRAAPPQMIAGEQVPVLNQQAHVAARVAGGRDGEEAGSQFDRLKAIENHLRAGLRGQFHSVNDAAAGETRGVFFGFGYVVAVC